MSSGKNPLVLMMALSMPGAANALGLGDIHVDSGLNEPLAAEIDIIGATATELTDLRVAVANRETFLHYGADRPGFLSSATFKVTQDMRKAGETASDAATIRKACDAYARKYIDIQREQFKRLGVLGDWENPYLTLNKEYEADELRLFADIVEQGFVYR